MIAITGANGLVGQYLIQLLLEANYKVLALVRYKNSIHHLSHHNLLVEEYDLLDNLSLEEKLKDVTTLIHTAAIISFYKKHRELMYETNIEGTKSVILACQKHNIHLIHLSSVAAIGRNSNNLELDENNKWVEGGKNTHYGKSKYLAELEVWRAMEEGLSVTILNPSVILSPSDWTKSSTKLFKYAYDEGIFYPGGSLNYIDIRDLGKIILKSIEKPLNQRFIINAGNISYKEFLHKVAKAFNKKAPSNQANKTIGLIMAYLMNLQSFFTKKEPLITKESILSSSSHIAFSNKKSKETFDIDYQPIDESISWVCIELKKKYALN